MDRIKALIFAAIAFGINLSVSAQIDLDQARMYSSAGIAYFKQNEYDLAIRNLQKALAINVQLFGINHTEVADSYHNLGVCYRGKGDHDLSVGYFKKALTITKSVLGEKCEAVANSYSSVGDCYMDAGGYDSAKIYHLNALKILTGIYGEKHATLIDRLNDIGECYRNKNENYSALEYFMKAAAMSEELLGANHPWVALCLDGIASSYMGLKDFNPALLHYKKALQIQRENYGENHPDLALTYMNIGAANLNVGDYDSALENEFRALEIYEKNGTGFRNNIAKIYKNIAYAYYFKKEIDNAFNYFLKTIARQKKILGEKHPELADNYNAIAGFYSSQGKLNLSLKYYQLALTSNLRDFNDSLDFNSDPEIRNFFDPVILLNSLYGKANVFFRNRDYQESFQNIKLCDSLIGQMRGASTSQSDKLSLALASNMICNEAIQLCYKLFIDPTSPLSRENLIEQAFLFSEKSKTRVLLESLAGQQGLKYAGIPDSLLQLENSINSNITFFERKLAESPDTLAEKRYRDQLFKFRRQYEELREKFEKEYPEYYNLKLSAGSPALKDIQKTLNSKTAILSFFESDSSIFRFTLTWNKLDMKRIDKIAHLNDSISWLRYSLANLSPRMQRAYLRIGFLLYEHLFPDKILTDKNITDLIIIPDGYLSTIPFECLLTSNYSGNIDNYKEYPFLIKKCNISYSYSADLFYRINAKQSTYRAFDKTRPYDFLALAPVFDYRNEGKITPSTRDLQQKLNFLDTDSLMLYRSIFNRMYIAPLPATKTEVQSIFRLFTDKDLKARILLENNANEQFIKSGGLEEYKTLHFATHGFVNSEHPELSGLLLAQDTTNGEDGVLYSGEIFNLKMNADLVVLSACETGLGKIQKGEGIIGLTRALIYAGAKNIIVSLWQVADQSTSDLMVSFYRETIENNGDLSYSEALRQAKLKMIGEGNFAHPLYWSPFILIGK